MNVLITGCNGYIGSLLTRRLLQAGHEVVGVDLHAPHHSLTPFKTNNGGKLSFTSWNIRHYTEPPAYTLDAIIHLAAVRLDLCESSPSHAEAVNVKGTANVLRWAEALKVPRFIFASTCSVYGKTPVGEYAAEGTTPNPTTVYAETKLKAEELVLKSGIGKVFRFGTVCGLSPNFRMDTLANQMAHYAALGAPMTLYDLDSRRPYVDINHVIVTLCRFAIWEIAEEPELLERNLFNVVDENLTKRELLDIAGLCQRHTGGPELKFTVEDRREARDYMALNSDGYIFPVSIAQTFRKIYDTTLQEAI